MKIKNFPLLVFCVLICEAAGAVGAYFTFPAVSSWYPGLIKPVFSPPNWLFGPVWTILYALMGISLYLVWKSGSPKKLIASYSKLFFVHLAVNSLWSIVFFGARNIFGALIVLVILWILIFTLIIKSAKMSKLASNLLLPYLAWVSFAGILNLSLFLLNR